MRFLPLLLLVVGCTTTPLTEREIEEREYIEQDRRNLYIEWEKMCLEAGGIIFMNNPIKPCHLRGCIPHAMDWKPGGGLNSVQCVSKQAMREYLRGW